MPVDKSGLRIRQMFGEIAPRYDLSNHVLSLGIDCWWRRRTTRLVPPGDGPVLDVCTGTGDLALAYWRAGRKRISVIGADFCRPMLTVGQDKSHHKRAQQWVHLVEADAQQLPFPDETFEVVCVAFGLRNVADTDRGLREMARVCRRRGRVAVLEFSTPRGWPMAGLYRFYFRHVLPRIGQVLARNRQAAYNYLPQSVGEFPQDEQLADKMRAAGLGKVEYHRLSLGIATLWIGSK